MYSLERLGGDTRLVTVSPGGVVAEASAGVTTTIPGLAAIAFATLNTTPVADAGPDQVVECTGAPTAGCAVVTLDGSGSSDPDVGDVLSFGWQLDGEAFPGSFAGVAPTPILKLGVHEFILTVDDGNGGTDTDTVTVEVVDTAGPTITSATASPDTLWPANHKMVDVTVTVDASDLCDGGAAACEITSVVSNEPDNGTGDGNTTGDIGTIDGLTVKLRAERSGQGTGRIYTITVEWRRRSWQRLDKVGHRHGSPRSGEEVVVVVPRRASRTGREWHTPISRPVRSFRRPYQVQRYASLGVEPLQPPHTLRWRAESGDVGLS